MLKKGKILFFKIENLKNLLKEKRYDFFNEDHTCFEEETDKFHISNQYSLN